MTHMHWDQDQAAFAAELSFPQHFAASGPTRTDTTRPEPGRHSRDLHARV
jgi:hypothetical protein